MRVKPEYEIPSMGTINKTELNGYKVVSTFSGGGGACLGLKQAGFDVVWANEFVEAAQQTYRANFPNTFLDPRDIRTVQAEEILDQCGLKKGELDVFEGSPPCNSFSTSGKGSKNWGKVTNYTDGKKQQCDDLFFEWIRLLSGLKPRMFIAENVVGLSHGHSKGVLKQVLKEQTAAGYRVKVWKLDGQWLGVPQSRGRLVFVGVRNDLEGQPEPPKPFPYRYTLKDAIWDLRNEPIFTPESSSGANMPSEKHRPETSAYSTGGGKRRPLDLGNSTLNVSAFSKLNGINLHRAYCRLEGR